MSPSHITPHVPYRYPQKSIDKVLDQIIVPKIKFISQISFNINQIIVPN